MRAKDADGVMSHYAADRVTFDLAQPLISSGADANGLQAWFSTWQGLIGYEIRNPEHHDGCRHGVLPQPQPAERKHHRRREGGRLVSPNPLFAQDSG
jgi:hypothetical protein